MTCESTRGTWGGRCPDCGEMLPPQPGEWRGWRSERIDPVISANARLSSTASYYSKHKAADYAKRLAKRVPPASFFGPGADSPTQGEVQL